MKKAVKLNLDKKTAKLDKREVKRMRREMKKQKRLEKKSTKRGKTSAKLFMKWIKSLKKFDVLAQDSFATILQKKNKYTANQITNMVKTFQPVKKAKSKKAA